MPGENHKVQLGPGHPELLVRNTNFFMIVVAVRALGLKLCMVKAMDFV